MIARLRITIIAVVLATEVAASERWTLADVVSDVSSTHPVLAASRERVAAAEGDLADAGRWDNPNLVVSGENLRFGADDFDAWTDAEWFVLVTQRIDTAGKKSLRKRAAEAGVDLAELEHAMLEREIVHRAKIAFQNVLTAQEKLALTRDSWARLEDLVELNRIRAVEGYVAEGDYIKSRLEAQRFEHALKKSDLALQQAKIRLLQAMGRTEFAIEFELVSPEVLSAAIDEAELRAAAATRPEILAAEAMVARAESVAELESALAHPDVAASAGYKRNGPANTLYLGMSVPLPILNRNQGGIVRGRAELAAAEAELTLQRSRVLGELQAALEAVRMTREQIDSLRTDFIDRADESLAVSFAAYTEGATALLTVLEAERTRNEAQELVVDAVHDYRLALYDLERAAGVSALARSDVVGDAP